MLQDIVAGNVYVFMLLFSRLGTALMLMPGIGETSIPGRARLSIALLMAAISSPILGPTLPPMPAQPFQLAFLLITEIGFGLAFGLLARMAMSALHVAGTVIAMQAGLSAATFFDPTQGAQNVLVSSMLVFFGVALVFSTDMHLLCLQAAYDSYTLFPPMKTPAFGDFANVATRMVDNGFALGIKLSAPFIVYGIIFNVALGLLNRLMPALQIFAIMQSPQIAMSLVVLGLSLTAIGLSFTAHFEEYMSQFIVPR